MSSDARDELDDDAVRQLEGTLFAARNYVVPSADLRPQLLEQAREASRIHVLANRLTVSCLACMLFCSVAVAAVRHLSVHRDRISGPFPHEIEERAQSYPNTYPYQPQWRTVDAFQDERGLKGKRIRSSLVD